MKHIKRMGWLVAIMFLAVPGLFAQTNIVSDLTTLATNTNTVYSLFFDIGLAVLIVSVIGWAVWKGLSFRSNKR